MNHLTQKEIDIGGPDTKRDEEEIEDPNLIKIESITETKEDEQKIVPLQKYKTNPGYLTAYVLIASIAMLQLGYILAANNQVQSILDVQFGLKDATTKNLYHTLISSSAVLGTSIGSGFGGKMISYGRRKAIIIINVICIICVIPTLFLNIYAICIGRLFHGFFTGMFQLCIPRMIEETVPLHLLGIFGPCTNLFNNGGKMLSIVMGGGLPSSSDKKAMAETQYWKVIFAIPLVLIAIQLVCFLFIFRQDTIKFSIDMEKNEDAKTHIQKVYHSSQDHEEIFTRLKSQCVAQHSNKIGLKQAMFSHKYRRATWFCFFLVIFNQLTGQNAILLYSTTIFQRMNAKGQGLDPKIGTILVGVINFVGAFIAIFTVKTFKRKPLFAGGHAIVTINLTLIGIFAYFGIGYGVIAMILFQLLTFQLTISPVTWIYVAEIASDAGLGFAMLVYKAAFLFVSLTTEFLMDSPLQPHGVFWMFAAISFIASIFHTLLMRETKDLSDREKKALYQILEEDNNQTQIVQTENNNDINNRSRPSV